MNTGVGELLDNFFTSSYHSYTFTNDPWLSLITRVPIQEGRIPVQVDIPQQGDVSGIITGQGLSGSDNDVNFRDVGTCLLYTSPSPRDRTRSRMPSSA